MPDDDRIGATVAATPIALYESIAWLSREMVAASAADDWARVAELEASCCRQIEQLRVIAATQPLCRGDAKRRVALLREILLHDAQIRVRSEPWLQQLESLSAPFKPAVPGPR